ncbi:WSC domain-containing protein [Colletotrichum truncatum]|uniref:WSC domain-containing protein n=1 Tax=Colletotrichum truncatum TaxID=5467 RepID=A0ACC3ZHA2_COLTU|nr:WSC domain-containing protein [Colletotrichum truncatum]KAF6790582.1 WSC domain-containing protein [Colletotrichum truncatum]
MKTFTNIAAVTSFLAVGADAFWRMECQGRVGLARVDPLMTFGKAAPHVHAIHGSNGISPTAEFSDLVAGDCTSCRVKQDMSAYWTPALYFQDSATGEFEVVEQVGGMLAYYLLNGKNIKAFPPGFRMIAGDTDRRNYTAGDPSKPDPQKSDWVTLGQTKQSVLEQRAVGFNCLNYERAPEGTLYRHFLPDKDYLDANCANGVRFEMMFPSCWNGKDKDSPDHKSHMAYPDLVIDGTCPEGFETSVPNLLYETIWNTYAFKNRAGRFVISNGDTQGYGYHGDFMSGWDEDFLQSAVDTCTNMSGRIEDCPVFSLQSESQVKQCSMKIPDILSTEDVIGPDTVLPGNVRITFGDGSSEGGAAPVSSSTIVAPTIPTLTYKPGKTATANPLPGQVFHESGKASYGYGSTSSTAPVVAQAASSAAPEPSTPEPTPTPIFEPVTTAPPTSTPKFVSTQTITDGNTVSIILWEEVIVYVTEYEDITTTQTVSATPTPAALRARHLHHHRRHHF